jgi:hypothetical protein
MILKIFFAVTFFVAVVGFCICYGSAVALLCWATFIFAGAAIVRQRFRKTFVSLVTLGLMGLLLWPLDAALHFPALSRLQSLVPFGPEIAVFPAPSDNCVAYVYNHSFFDGPSYAVRFAHGLAFPGKPHWVPLGKLSDARIEPKWDSNIFSVDVSGVGITLSYDQRTRVVKLRPE